MPNAKYDYRVGGKIAKNSRNKAFREIGEAFKADDEHNFETVMNELSSIKNELKNMVQRLEIIEQKLGIMQQSKKLEE